MCRDTHLGDKLRKKRKEVSTIKINVVFTFVGRGLLTVTGHIEDIEGDWQSSKRMFPYENVISYIFSVWFSVFLFIL